MIKDQYGYEIKDIPPWLIKEIGKYKKDPSFQNFLKVFRGNLGGLGGVGGGALTKALPLVGGAALAGTLGYKAGRAIGKQPLMTEPPGKKNKMTYDDFYTQLFQRGR